MADRFVALSGINSNPGSIGAPYRTLNYAVTQIFAGDTLWLRGPEFDGLGSWDESLWFNIPAGTSWGNKVRIANYPGETPRIKPLSNATGDPTGGGNGRCLYFAGNSFGGNVGAQCFIEVDGIILDASAVKSDAVKIESNSGAPLGGYNAHHLRIQNCDIIGGQNLHDGGLNGNMCILISSQHAADVGFHEVLHNKLHEAGADDTFGYGVYCQASDVIISYNEFYNLNGAGVQVYNGYVGDLQASRNLISYNSFHDNVRSADTRTDPIIFGRGDSNKAINNKIYNNGGALAPNAVGIYWFHGTNLSGWNNTLYNNGHWGMMLEPAVVGISLRNNIIYLHTINYQDNGASGVTEDHNDRGATDPNFVNAAAADFRLTGTSIAVNTGATIAAATPDFAGNARPQGAAFCRGVFELASGTTTLAPGSATFSYTVPAVTLGMSTISLAPGSANFGWGVPDVGLGRTLQAVPSASFSWSVPPVVVLAGTTVLDAGSASFGFTVPDVDLIVAGVPQALDPSPASFTWQVDGVTLAPGSVSLDPSPAIFAWGVPAVTLNVQDTETTISPDAVSFSWGVPTVSLVLGGTVHLTQGVVEVLQNSLGQLRLTQAVIDAIHQPPSITRLTQVVIEVLFLPGDEPIGCTIEMAEGEGSAAACTISDVPPPVTVGNLTLRFHP